MGTLNKKFAKFGAVLAISSFAIIGCSSGTSEDTKASSEMKVEAKSQEGAASFANFFLATLIEEDKTDYDSLKPPIELTEDQVQELMLDGKVDGVSDEDLNSLMDFLYENQPLGKYVYFADGAPIQDRLQAISALILAQSYAAQMVEDKAPEKITAEQVELDERNGMTVAIIEADENTLAPPMVFVNGEWKIDGAELLISFGIKSNE